MEKQNKSKQELIEIGKALQALSDSTRGSYKISKICYVERLPRTSVGKVQRYVLKELCVQNSQDIYLLKGGQETSREDAEVVIWKLLGQNLCNNKEILYTSRLSEDLGMDSLALFEMCVKIENYLGIDISEYMSCVKTVGDLLVVLKDGDLTRKSDAENCLKDYPKRKSRVHMFLFKLFMYFSKTVYRFEVDGIDNIESEKQYIFCPNHESYFDSMWVWTALKDIIDLRKIGCLATQKLLKKKITRLGLVITGGIPVDRIGNTAPAIKRAMELIAKEKYNFLVHPEGTRSRSGKLGDFKLGAAELSIQSGIPIIPVCIKGAYEIFPPNRKYPRLYDFKNHQKLSISITFGEPIEPTGKTKEQITYLLREKILFMDNLMQ